MAYKDLREFILKLEEEKELQRIKAEVDWDLELSAIMRKIYEVKGPACLFENVKGSTFPVLSGAFFGYKKYGLAVEASPNIRSILQKVLRASQNPITPITVSGGPCKEHIDTGDSINLEKFPVPRWHHLDGGRYIGTLGVVISRDPETGKRNMGVYRQQMIGKNKLGMLGSQHFGIHLQKYRAQNRAMPVATAIGVPPAALAAACVQIPFGEDELGVAGGIAGEPIPLVKCETIDLEVPAHAEIVLEGEIPPDVSLWKEEGPYGEFTGYFSDLLSVKRPTVHLSAVTYRDNPIYQGCSPGIPPNEETIYREIGNTVGAWHRLLKSGVPGIHEVYATEMGCAQFMMVVSMKQQFYFGNVRQVIDTIFGSMHTVKWIIVVDDDIDIYDRGQVEWALATRVQPHRDIIVSDDRCAGMMLDPSIPLEMRKYPLVQGSRIGIDATTRYKGFQFPAIVRSGEEQKQLVERRWKEYGFQ